MSLPDGYSFFSFRDNEPFFSNSSCDDCDSGLGGNRYDVVCRETSDPKSAIVYLELCEDCFLKQF